MINEGEAGEGGGEEGGVGGVGAALGDAPALGDALDQPGVIQVSPQDKEAIERVSPSPRFFCCLGAAFDKGGSFFAERGKVTDKQLLMIWLRTEIISNKII